jgi:pimeloyl-ACP methyl ester carboxylesterase
MSSTKQTRFPLVMAVATVLLATMVSVPAAREIDPVRRQLRWVVRQLNGAGRDLTTAEVKKHFAPIALKRLPAKLYVQLLRESAAQAGAVRVSRIAGTSSPWALIAVIDTENLGPAGIYLNTQRRDHGRITSLEISDVPGPSAKDLATPGPYTGAFAISSRRQLYMTCAGEGSPTVILEGGGGAGAATWTAVQPHLSDNTRVCSYDRANVPGGASSFASKPRTATDVVADLHALIHESGLPGPYVLVGHSNGGVFARLYASLHPDGVEGLVLVDSAHEDQELRRDEIMQQYFSEEEWEAILEARRQQAALPFVSAIGDEAVDMMLSFNEMRAARTEHPLPPMELSVMSHGKVDPPAPGEPEGMSEALEELWQELQDDLASLAPGSERTVVEDSGHQIPLERPDAVVDAIKRVIASIQNR